MAAIVPTEIKKMIEPSSALKISTFPLIDSSVIGSSIAFFKSFAYLDNHQTSQLLEF